MTDDQYAALDTALEVVISAARRHLDAVKAAGGRPDDDTVWSAYVELNNAVVAYDDTMLEGCGEVTPWDVHLIDPDDAAARLTAVPPQRDAKPIMIAVRQRRDFLVPNAAALLEIAQKLRVDTEDIGEVSTIGEAVVELLQSGDGSLSALDIPELEPLDGVATVSEITVPLDLNAVVEDDVNGLFASTEGDKLVGRFDEQAIDEDEDE
ncbi:MAG: hypothetical protein H0T78_06370 [Longispora sp.]|nr:hypothetical protein [Longispora sp. (in: high G+C Gram-positive bacteria)]